MSEIGNIFTNYNAIYSDRRPNLMNLSCVSTAYCPFKFEPPIKSSKGFESMIYIWPGDGRQFKFIKFGLRFMLSIYFIRFRYVTLCPPREGGGELFLATLLFYIPLESSWKMQSNLVLFIFSYFDTGVSKKSENWRGNRFFEGLG